MEVKSIKTNINEIMKRTEGNAVIEFESTLKIEQAKELVAKKLALENKDLLKILKVETKFGKHIADVTFEVYDDSKLMKDIEVLAKKARTKVKEEAKKAFEAKKQAKATQA